MTRRPELIIDRQKWARGNGTDHSALMLPNKTFCCLGFLCLQSGLTEDDILLKKLPSYLDLLSVGDKFKLFSYTYHNCHFSVDAAKINDDTTLIDSEREEKLISLFDKAGINIKFIN